MKHRGVGSTATQLPTLTHCPYCSLQCGVTHGRRRPAGHPPAAAGLPDQPRRTVLQGLDRDRPARPPRAPAQPAGADRPRRPHQPVPRGHLGRGARRDRRRDPPRPGRLRAGRGRLLRRRRPHQREGVPARQVRPGRAADPHDRLQRPVLHVVGGRGGEPRLRHRPRAAVPARRPRRGRQRSCWSAPTRPTTMPPAMQFFDAGRARGAQHIVVDPRRTADRPRARRCTCSPRPGTDLALANGLLHIAIREGLVDEEYVARAHHGVRRGPRRRRLVLAGPGRADHRRPGRRPARDRRSCSRPRRRRWS